MNSLDIYLDELTKVFSLHKNESNARGQKRYMKNHFEFLGLKSPVRRELQKPFFHASVLPDKEYLPVLIEALWNLNEREYQYFGQELFARYLKLIREEDISILAYMITHKSWWDTVDFIAARLVGPYFNHFPDKIPEVIPAWVNSGNIWLQRSALLFQLHYKEKTDTSLLENIIAKLTPVDEFFINKAVGWILRQYARTNPQWVREYVRMHDLHPLSRREATKHL